MMDMNKTTAQSKETYEKMSFAAAEAANLIQSSCTTAFEGVQTYNKKLVEFTRENTTAAFDFVQKLYDIKSPSEFIELSTKHARAQTEVLAGQTEQLRALAQKIALASTEPLKSGAAKAAGHNA
jgi:phasin